MTKRNHIQKKYVSAYDHRVPFAILVPEYTPSRDITEVMYDRGISVGEIDRIINVFKKSPSVALDYEAKGTDIHTPAFKAVGIGLGGDSLRVYIRNSDAETWNYLHTKLLELNNLIAHNVMFDGAVFKRYAGKHANWIACTLGLYKQCANEGFDGQRWGLKSAQVDVLEWEQTNDEGIDKWLIEHGYISNGPKPRINESSTEYRQRLLEWNAVPGNQAKAKKAEMWRVPSAILGEYCIMDCEATYLLYEKHLKKVYNHFPDLKEYQEDLFIPLVKKLIDQYLGGITIDVKKMQEHGISLRTKIAELENEIRTDSDLTDAINEAEARMIDVVVNKEPTKFKKLPKLPNEPAKLKKNGKPSKAWDNWVARCEKINNMKAEVTLMWQKWRDKMDKIEAGDHPDFRFNLNSRAQLKKIIYGQIVPNRITKEPISFDEFGRGRMGEVEIETPEGRKVKLDMTKAGQLPLGELAFKQMGTMGELLNRHSSAQKELQFVTKYLEIVQDGKIHAGWKIPGTITGRVAGVNPNLVQAPKSKGFLECFVPEEGNVLVDCDFSSLENVVLAELSKDKSLMELYGPKAKANDGYLFTGSQLPKIGEKILAAGYDPKNPTLEGIANAKKICKKERSIAKVVVLASSYGAGVGKILKTLNLSGIDITYDQVKKIHEGYWEIFSGVKRYEAKLQEEWRDNDGYMTSKLGYPIACAEKKEKDLINRQAQRLGHDCCMIWIEIFTSMLDEEGIPWKPYVIDWHDQSIVEVPKEHAERVAEIMGKDSFDVLNNILQWEVQLKGDPQIVNNLAEAKIED